MKDINESNKDEILKSGLVMVKFGADWCGPCKYQGRILETADPKLPIYSCDVDSNPTWSNQMKVTAIPLNVFFKNGKEISRHTGILTIDNINKIFAENED